MEIPVVLFLLVNASTYSPLTTSFCAKLDTFSNRTINALVYLSIIDNYVAWATAGDIMFSVASV